MAWHLGLAEGLGNLGRSGDMHVTSDRRILLAGAALVAATAFSHGAMAQVQRTGYEAKGLPMGAFTAFPKVSISAESNDNIYAQTRRPVEDVVWRVQPEVSVVSDWSRHSLSAFAKASINRYQDSDKENSEEYAVGADGRVDVRRTTRFTGGVSLTRATEPRTAANAVGAATVPTEYDVARSYVGGEQEFNRLMLSAKVGYETYDYSDVRSSPTTVIDQDYRDRKATELMGRADYSVSPDTALFVEITGNQRKYDQVRPRVALTRDSDGVTVLAGAKFDLTAVVRGEVSAGYLKQSFDDLSQKDISGLAVRTKLEWFPSRLTAITFSADRNVQDSALANSAALVSETVGVKLGHDLRRNVRLAADLGYGRDTYKDINRRDRVMSGGASATYLVNRNVGLSLSYNHMDRDIVRGTGVAYKVNKLLAALTLQF